MNDISGHMGPLAFLLKKNNGRVQMWTKQSSCDDVWLGCSEDNSIGWEIFHSLPPQAEDPQYIAPTPIPEEAYDNLEMTYPWLNTESRNWWNNWIENQFFLFPENLEVLHDMWNVEPPENRPNEIDLFAEGIQQERGATILIRNQIPQSASQFTVGELIAVRAPDEVDEHFWIAKISEICPAEGEQEGCLKFDYYMRHEKNDRRYTLDEGGTFGSCSFTAVLAHGFQLTQQNLLKVVTSRRIASML